jgi:hypothetical protein
VSELRSAWSRLHPAEYGEQGYVRLRLPSVSACPAYAARKISDGTTAIMLEVHADAVSPNTEYPQSKGFEITVDALEPGRAGRIRLVLALVDPRFGDVFGALCEDVVGSLISARGEASAVQIFLSRLFSWQAFLRKHDPGGLTLQARRGLYGELIAMLDFIERGLPPEEAVQAWKGCRGAPHDFQLKHGSLEVKTTSASTPHSFHVSNVAQLDDSGVETLFVLLVVLYETEGGAQSLPELVQAIRERLQSSAIDAFDSCLREAGYLDVHSELYANPRYTIRTQRYFRIHSGFPRLLPAALPLGVEDVTYTVSIAACTPSECTAEVFFSSVLPVIANNDV